MRAWLVLAVVLVSASCAYAARDPFARTRSSMLTHERDMSAAAEAMFVEVDAKFLLHECPGATDAQLGCEASKQKCCKLGSTLGVARYGCKKECAKTEWTVCEKRRDCPKGYGCCSSPFSRAPGRCKKECNRVETKVFGRCMNAHECGEKMSCCFGLARSKGFCKYKCGKMEWNGVGCGPNSDCGDGMSCCEDPTDDTFPSRKCIPNAQDEKHVCGEDAFLVRTEDQFSLSSLPYQDSEAKSIVMKYGARKNLDDDVHDISSDVEVILDVLGYKRKALEDSEMDEEDLVFKHTVLEYCDEVKHSSMRLFVMAVQQLLFVFSEYLLTSQEFAEKVPCVEVLRVGQHVKQLPATSQRFYARFCVQVQEFNAFVDKTGKGEVTNADVKQVLENIDTWVDFAGEVCNKKAAGEGPQRVSQRTREVCDTIFERVYFGTIAAKNLLNKKTNAQTAILDFGDTVFGLGAFALSKTTSGVSSLVNKYALGYISGKIAKSIKNKAAVRLAIADRLAVLMSKKQKFADHKEKFNFIKDSAIKTALTVALCDNKEATDYHYVLTAAQEDYLMRKAVSLMATPEMLQEIGHAVVKLLTATETDVKHAYGLTKDDAPEPPKPRKRPAQEDLPQSEEE